MKSRLSTLFIAAALLGMSACDSLFELEPQASISDDVALSTPGNVQTAVVGGYAILGGANTYGGSYIYLTDIFAAPTDEVFFNGTFLQPREVNTKAILTDNSFIAAYWSGSYNVINRANNVLSATGVFGSDAAAKAKAEAEAKFLRGAAYFNLAQVFGKAFNDGNPATNLGVPIVLVPTRGVSDELKVARNTVQDVYTRITTDLTEARDALPQTNGVFANTFTASALLTRVYLAMGDYAKAGAEAQRVIASNRYTLFPDIRGNYVRISNGSETIFAVQNTATAFNNDMAVFYAPLPYGRADIQVRDAHLTRYEAGDARATLFVTTSRGRMSAKYASPDGVVDPRRTNITVLRLAEMHLVRAEVNARLRAGGSNAFVGGATPETDINAIRARVGLAAKETVTLADVLAERRNELMFEGVLFMDLKRLQETTRLQGSPDIQWNDPRLVFPIPQREMLANPNLVQNDSYGS
jgi:starch-binding outer membrane protein, SusD/RagB family